MRTPQSESEVEYLIENGSRNGAGSGVEGTMELETIDRLL